MVPGLNELPPDTASDTTDPALIGMLRRYRRIFRPNRNRAVIVPFDDALISGPDNVAGGDPWIMGTVAAAKPDALVGFQGATNSGSYADSWVHLPFIANMTLSTELWEHTRKYRAGTVQLAAFYDSAAVAVHVNALSRYADEQYRTLEEIALECIDYGMPLIGFIYPRGETPDGRDENFIGLRDTDPHAYASLIAGGIKRAIEVAGPCLRAIKTHYTGTSDSFGKVVEAAEGRPIVIAGGPLKDTSSALQWAYNACQAGANGTSFGRNTFNNTQPAAMVYALKGIVHADLTVAEAMDMAGLEQ